MTAAHRSYAAGFAVLLAVLLATACAKQGPTTPKSPAPDDILLTIDGIDIRFGEVQPILEFLASSHPEAGRKTVMQMVLEKQIVPVRLAQRAFGEARRHALQEATDLRSIATNALELDAQNVKAKQRKIYARSQVPLPAAMFLFDPLQTGGVSAPLEVPRGYVVTAAHDYVQRPLAGEDLVEATLVGFFTHGDQEWGAWLAAEQDRIADKITYVHPLYVEALPGWCKHP
ncbi:MAG: hypothetical protein KDC98_04170 [Planctomycetes bacterium]|nr:hypothetical protein [Planctomycetota bacterium]